MEWIRGLCRIFCLIRATSNLNNLKENEKVVEAEEELENAKELNFDFLDKLPALLIFQIFSFTTLKPLDLRVLNHKFDTKIKNLYEKILRKEFHREIRGIPLFWSFNVTGVKFIHQMIPSIKEIINERRSERMIKAMAKLKDKSFFIRTSLNLIKAKPEAKRKISFLSNDNEKVYCVDESLSLSSSSAIEKVYCVDESSSSAILFESENEHIQISVIDQFRTKTKIAAKDLKFLNYSCEIKLMDLWSRFLKISEETRERKLLHFLADFLIYIQVSSLISQLKPHLVSLLLRVHDYDLSLAFKIIKLLGCVNFLSFKNYRRTDKEAVDKELGLTTEQSAELDSMIDQKSWNNYDNKMLRALCANIIKTQDDEEKEKVNNDRWRSCFELPNEIFAGNE